MTTACARPLRVAILGARGIGRVHARILGALGAQVTAVLGSSAATAAAAAHDLSDSFGIAARPFSSLELLLQEPLDAVSICTPARMHVAQISAAFDRGLAVFCEKPLLWDDTISVPDAERCLQTLSRHPRRRLFVNTSNTLFADPVRDQLGDLARARQFTFRFHTRGRYRGPEIAVDLFPHGAALLLRLFGQREVTDYRSAVADQRYQATFRYGPATTVCFDFREDPQGEKAFAFSVDGREFHRLQSGEGATYQAYLVDGRNGLRYAVADPFVVALSAFCRYCTGGGVPGADGFDEAAANLRMMVRCLSAPLPNP